MLSWRMVRESVVAGAFYPADPVQLQNAVTRYMALAPTHFPEGRLRAVLVPHSGFIYSAPIAAAAYVHLVGREKQFQRIMAIGPAHRGGFSGLALTTARQFATPLGPVEIDADFGRSLSGFSDVVVHDTIHRMEHSLEMQMPFLKCTLPRSPVVPILTGNTLPNKVEPLLVSADSPQNLLVVTSDLTHYRSYDEACRQDAQTAARILDLDENIPVGHACGSAGLVALLRHARRKGWRPCMLDLRNSGDTVGDREQVVGFGAFAFWD